MAPHKSHVSAEDMLHGRLHVFNAVSALLKGKGTYASGCNIVISPAKL
jgi:hypothetical protein